MTNTTSNNEARVLPIQHMARIKLTVSHRWKWTKLP